MATKRSLNISVVVAAYNEEAVISRSLKRVLDELRSRPDVAWELICVNDGSKDKTGVLMDEFAAGTNGVKVLHHRRNFGQGRALRTAFDICRGEVIVTLDADLSYGPEYIYRLVDALREENVEIALASPYVKGGTVRNVPFHRHMFSRLGNRYLSWMSPYSISTSTCVVRAYRREVLDSVVLTADGMELQLDVLIKAHSLGFRVCEVPAQLEWTKEKTSGAVPQRRSKMRIMRTMQTYLFMGWLTRPAVIFMGLSCLLLLIGLFMFGALFFRVQEHMHGHAGEAWMQAVSLSLQEVFKTYTYSFIIYGGIFLIGLQIFTYALLLLQNKYYFEELFRLGQELRKVQARMEGQCKEEERQGETPRSE